MASPDERVGPYLHRHSRRFVEDENGRILNTLTKIKIKVRGTYETWKKKKGVNVENLEYNKFADEVDLLGSERRMRFVRRRWFLLNRLRQ